MDISFPRVLPGLPATLPIPSIDRSTAADGAAGVAGPSAGSSAAQGAAESFSVLLSQAAQDLNQVQQTADTGAAQLAAGAPVDLHNVLIGMEQANLSFGLAMQVRNKLLEAYQEISRMPI